MRIRFSACLGILITGVWFGVGGAQGFGSNDATHCMCIVLGWWIGVFIYCIELEIERHEGSS